MANIHPTALIDPSAQIAESAVIGAYVLVGPECVVGDDVVLHPLARLVSHVTLERGVKLHSGVVLGDIPQHLAYKEHPGRVFIGAECTLREGVTVHRPYVVGGETRVGANCFLMANAHVAHDCVLGERVTLVNGALLAGHVHIESQATLSGCVLIHQYCRIGRLAMISGGAQITLDVPPFSVCSQRNELHGLNVVGLRRAGFTPGQRKGLKRAFVQGLAAGGDLALALARTREVVAGLAEADRAAAAELAAWLEFDHPRGFLRFAPGGAAAEEAAEG